MPSIPRSSPARSCPSGAVLMGLALLLGGCTTGTWVRDGATQADHDRDSFRCQREAALMYPANPREVPYGADDSVSRTVCKTKNNVKTCEQRSQAPMTYLSDSNEGNRGGAYEACMRAEGYRFQVSR